MLKKYADLTSVLLNMDCFPVGIKIAMSFKEYNRFDGKELKRKINYCVAVKSASLGHSIKMTEETSACPGSTRSLGFNNDLEEFLSGQEGLELGLYKNKEVSKEVASKIQMLSADTYGVIIKPLEYFEENPDIVLLVAKPREIMRVLQGYSYTYGLDNYSLSGNQAVCVEATATPIIKNKLNISMFCSGTRHYAAWSDDKLLAGVPYSKYFGFIDGLIKTVNPTEYDERKKEIEQVFIKYDVGEKIIYGETYFCTKG